MLTPWPPSAKSSTPVGKTPVGKAADQHARQGFLILPIFTVDVASCVDMALIDYALATAHYYTLSQLHNGNAQAFIRLDTNGMRAQAVVAAPPKGGNESGR